MRYSQQQTTNNIKQLSINSVSNLFRILAPEWRLDFKLCTGSKPRVSKYTPKINVLPRGGSRRPTTAAASNNDNNVCTLYSGVQKCMLLNFHLKGAP